MKLADSSKQLIQEYYDYFGMQVIFVESILDFLSIFKCYRQKFILVSSNRLYRGMGRILGVKQRGKLQSVLSIAEQTMAMKDALLLLNKKNIPVYFYNRIGKEKENFVYSETALNRMSKGLSFPVMYENIDFYETDFRELFGECFSKNYVLKIGKIPQVIRKGDIYCHEDSSGEYVNVVQGKRITCYQPTISNKTIHIYGRCGAFGYAVEDKDTFPSQLQLFLNESGIDNIRVENHGLWGGSDEYLDHNFMHDALGMKEGDIVLFYRKHIDKCILAHWQQYGVLYKEITHEWHAYPEAKWCFYDKPGHMNNIGYKNVAKLIGQDLIEREFKCGYVNWSNFPGFKPERLTKYLKDRNNPEFYQEIHEYTKGILNKYPLTSPEMQCGAIVMNCNPFTYGHRYLIEHAASQVERLYIFVVEEDKSFFKFADRFEMVEKGTSDIANVVVVSSGKFIISSLTFPEYFMKDYVKEKNFDVTMDLEVFCKHISAPLNIKKRFAGEEPFDPVTLNYNENMRKILPSYGMEFCEIPRYTTSESKIINATEVRRLLKMKDFEAIKQYVPDTTLQILRLKYSN